MIQKKQRLDRLVGRLIDDDLLFKKFKGNKSNIKQQHVRNTMMNTDGMNPDIQAIESLFTPGV